MNLAYSILRGNPFSSYGDVAIVLLQQVIIVCLIWAWGIEGKKHSLTHIGSIVAVAVAAGVFIFKYLPPSFISFLLLYSSVSSISSRIPQIISNYKGGKVGVQSIVTYIAAVLGNAVKLFVAIVELKDNLRALTITISMILNLVVLLQVLQLQRKTLIDKKTE